MDINEYEIYPKNQLKIQSGGNFPQSPNRTLRILKIFKTLANNNSFDDNFNLFKQDGTINQDADIVELLELTQSKQDRITGLEDFVYQLIKANIDLNLILNTNIKERLRAAREKINPNNHDNDNNDDMDDNGAGGENFDNNYNNDSAMNNDGENNNGANSTNSDSNNGNELESLPGPSNKFQNGDELKPLPENNSEQDGNISPIIGDERFDEPNWNDKNRGIKRSISSDSEKGRKRICDKWHYVGDDDIDDEMDILSNPDSDENAENRNEDLLSKKVKEIRKYKPKVNHTIKTHKISRPYNIRSYRKKYHLDSETDEDDDWKKLDDKND